MGLFRAASLRTRCAPFNAPGSPAIYAACATGFAWIQAWQSAQTMRVLRRILAMRAARAGWPGPGLPSWLSAATWWTATVMLVLAQLACPLEEPVDQFLAGVADPGRGGVMDDRAPVLPEGDPAEPCYQIRLGLAVPSGFEAGPGAVAGDSLRLVPGGHLGHGGLVLGGQGLQHRCLGVPAQRAEPPDILGEQVVAGDAPVFGSVDPDDVVSSRFCRPGRCQGLPRRRQGAVLALITSGGTRSAILPLADRRP